MDFNLSNDEIVKKMINEYYDNISNDIIDCDGFMESIGDMEDCDIKEYIKELDDCMKKMDEIRKRMLLDKKILLKR